VGHHIRDSPVHEEIDEEGFPAERRDRVKPAVHLAKRPLDSGNFGNMPELTGHAEVLRIGELRAGKHLVEYLKRLALMGQHGSAPGITTERCHLHREGADIHADVGHKTRPF
jgi:hypothetical protein